MKKLQDTKNTEKTEPKKDTSVKITPKKAAPKRRFEVSGSELDSLRGVQ